MLSLSRSSHAVAARRRFFITRIAPSSHRARPAPAPGIPSSSHRDALLMCARKGALDEARLVSALGCAPPEGAAIVRWLRGLDFVRTMADGSVSLDPIVREALTVQRCPHESADAPSPHDGAWFCDALRRTLPHFRKLHLLADSPLLQTRVGRAAGAAGLRALIESVIERMAVEPGYVQSARVLRATYVAPPQKQQAVAAELRLPFGTYRHHLRQAIDDLAQLLSMDESALPSGVLPR